MPALHVDPRFNGPPGVVNGGYACATLAQALGGMAEVTLRRPVPVGTDLQLERSAGSVTLASTEGELLAEAKPGSLDVVAPEPVSLAAAEAAMQRGPTRRATPDSFPCFVCSGARSDGFQVTPGPVADRDAVAAVWQPDAELADAQGNIPDVFSWAVLDCTGSIGSMLAHGRPRGVVLGRMTAEVRGPVRAGERLVAVGWAEPPQGRKLPACAALFREDGELLGRARLLCFAA